MYRPAASAESLGIDVTNEYLIRCMLDNSETDFWSEESVCQEKFGLKNMLAYPTSSLACATLPTSTPSPWVYTLDRAYRVVSEKLCLQDGE